MGMCERIKGFRRWQIDDALLIMLDGLLGLSQFLMAEPDIVVGEAE